jgi:hypothetical protein
MRYHHSGIPTTVPQPGEVYLESYDIHCTDHRSNPFGLQWMRYGERCTLPAVVREKVHLAFEVDDLEKALEGKKIIIHPNSPSEGVVVAFILENGVPIEFLEFTESSAAVRRGGSGGDA